MHNTHVHTNEIVINFDTGIMGILVVKIMSHCLWEIVAR